jgi:hypothetical protein
MPRYLLRYNLASKLPVRPLEALKITATGGALSQPTSSSQQRLLSSLPCLEIRSRPQSIAERALFYYDYASSNKKNHLILRQNAIFASRASLCADVVKASQRLVKLDPKPFTESTNDFVAAVCGSHSHWAQI